MLSAFFQTETLSPAYSAPRKGENRYGTQHLPLMQNYYCEALNRRKGNFYNIFNHFLTVFNSVF